MALNAFEFSRVYEILEKAAFRSEGWTMADLQAWIAADQAQLWTTEHSAVVTQVIEDAGVKTLYYLAAAGSFQEMKTELQPHIEAWALDVGCTTAVINARPGWARKMADFQIESIQLKKSL